MYALRGLGASTLAQTIASAITRQENTNPAYNNPGGLVSGPGQVGTASNGIAIFPDLATGQAAELNLVQKYIDNGASIASMINAWAPAPSAACGGMCTGNNPSAYAQNVGTWTGIDPTIPLNSMGGASASTGAAVDTGSADVFNMPSGLDLSSIDWTAPFPWVIAASVGIGLVLITRNLS